MKRLTLSLAAVGLLVGMAPNSRADFIRNTTGITNPGQVIDFDERVFPQDTPITNQYSGVFGPEGATFITRTPTPGFDTFYYYTAPIPAVPPFPNIVGQNIANFPSTASALTPSPYTFSIVFDQPQIAAAFALVTNAGSSVFRALLSGVLVETSLPQMTDTTSPNNFYGFQNIVFNEIEVTVTITTPPIDASLALDQVQFSAVPEPSSIVLGSLAGLGLFAQAWRRRKQSQD
jgi:hypothetical protein